MENFGDNGFFAFMNRIGDIIFLNLIFLVTCLPIVTIGVAMVSLHSVTLKMAKGQEGYVIRGYMKAFKNNLKQGLLVGIPLEILLVVLVVDSRFLLYSTESYRDMGLVVTLIALIFLILVMQYLFPLMARYDNSIKNTICNAALLVISKLPYTILLLIIAAVPVALVYITPYALIYVLFAGFSVSALLQGKLLNYVFGKVEEVSENKE